MKMVLGDRIKALREKRGILQLELAEKIGISKSAMSKIESESRKLEDTLLIKIADVLETSADYLLGIELKNPISEKDNRVLEGFHMLDEDEQSHIQNTIDMLNKKRKN